MSEYGGVSKQAMSAQVYHDRPHYLDHDLSHHLDHVHLCFLPLLQDLTHTAIYSWGGAVLAHTYRELYRASLDRRRDIRGCITLIHVCNIFFYYIHIHIHNTSLGCLLSVYFIFSYGLGRDFTWGDLILGDQ